MPALSYEEIELAVLALRGLKKIGYNDLDVRFRLRKAHNENIIDAAFEYCNKEDAALGGTATHSLKENNNFYGWYSGPHQNGDFHWPRLKYTLLNKNNPWTEDMVNSLDSASSLVVSYLAPPKSEKSIRSKGLVLGYIQSGKTANFSATIAKAVDEGYKLIIVLAGLHNNLRKQTEVRLREELVYPSNQKTCDNLTSDEETGDFNRKQTLSANRSLAKKDGFTLAVIKKNANVLRNLKAWLEEADQELVRKCPTLIIDDESDQASVNTNKEEDDPTTINNLIRKLFGKFDLVSYVGYTATPFANVFINSQDSDDLYPRDFLIALDKPKSYYGPDDLFGRDFVNGKQSNEGMNVIRTVPDFEADSLKNSISRKYTIELVPSLKGAIDSFLLAAGLRIYRQQRKNHICMLVHLTHLTGPQEELKEVLEKYIFKLGNQIEDDSSQVRERFVKMYESDFSKVTAELLGPQLISFDKIWENIKFFIKRLEILMDNSNSSRRLTFDPDVLEGFPLWAIVVGGNTLSRGLTLEGLTTSYFIRDSKAYDTLLQMGRWFGYRKGYADLTRIFVTNELFNHFYHLATVEQEIRDEIAVMAANGEKPIDVALRIRKHPSLLITARNRMRSAITTTLTFGGTKIQSLQLNVTNKSILEKNESTVVKLLEQINSGGKSSEKVPFKDLENCFLFRTIKVDLILDFLSEIEISENNAKFNTKLIKNYIVDSLNIGELKNWSVAVMSLKHGPQIEVAGLKVHPMNRRVKHEMKLVDGNIEATLRAISTPGEELIDLGDQISQVFKSTDDILSPKNGKQKSDTQIRNESRPKDRGLLMIYPLQSGFSSKQEELTDKHEEEAASYPLTSTGQVFAFSLVFPKSSVSTSIGEYMMLDLNKKTKERKEKFKNDKEDYKTKESIKKIKVLNIAQPHANEVIFKGKNVENRTRPTNLRGTIAIYASKTINRSRFEGSRISEEDCVFGCIIGFVELVECITEDQVNIKTRKWFQGPFGYVLQNVVVLKKPIEVSPPKGAVTWWNLSGKELDECLEQIPETVKRNFKPAV